MEIPDELIPVFLDLSQELLKSDWRIVNNAGAIELLTFLDQNEKSQEANVHLLTQEIEATARHYALLQEELRELREKIIRLRTIYHDLTGEDFLPEDTPPLR